MHQGLEDEKGMASALDKAPGHTTDSTAARPSRSPAMTAWQPGSEPSLLGRPLLALQSVRVMAARPKIACRVLYRMTQQ